jgi:hypothetical protein
MNCEINKKRKGCNEAGFIVRSVFGVNHLFFPSDELHFR